MARQENVEKMIAKILHRHCEFGWAHYYIPSEKFPHLVDELLKVLQPVEEAGEDELAKADEPQVRGNLPLYWVTICCVVRWRLRARA